MYVKDIRRQNLLNLLEEFGSQSKLGQLTDTPPSYFSQVIHGVRDLGDAVCMRIEQCLAKPAGWMDRHHAGGVKDVDGDYFSTSNLPMLTDNQIFDYLKGKMPYNDIKKAQTKGIPNPGRLSKKAFCYITQSNAINNILPGMLLVIDPETDEHPGNPSLWDVDGSGTPTLGVFVKNGATRFLKYDNQDYPSDKLGRKARRIGTVKSAQVVFNFN